MEMSRSTNSYRGHPVRYALLIHYPQPADNRLSEEEIRAGMAAFQAYS